ncbi:MAG: LysR family transcriptional regulator [Brachymonas sp.]
MNRIPSTQALQCFEASARLKGFTLAGDELHLTQGGVSRQILGLEQRLGVALFDRHRSGLN